LIVTADDFGLASQVNEAIEAAHRHGILTAASLMVAGAAAADAVRRARSLPSLKVGLHLALVDSRPVSSTASVPDLVDAAGNFRQDMVATSIAIASSRKVRRQVALEIAAQFERFQATGLRLDHVDAHKHFHLHPIVAALVCRIGRQYGMQALRAPVEPAGPVRCAEQALAPATRERANLSRISVWLTRRFATKLQRQIRGQGFKTADQVFGLAWSGALNAARLCALVPYLPEGLTEIYCHPATADTFAGGAPGYRYCDELAALLEPRVAAAVHASDVRLTAYSDLAGSSPRAPIG
jgi:chitin disaccharide deacetylase